MADCISQQIRVNVLQRPLNGLSIASDPVRHDRLRCRHLDTCHRQSKRRLFFRRTHQSSKSSRPRVRMLTTYESILFTFTLLSSTSLFNKPINILTFAGSLHSTEEAMKQFTGLCASAVPRNVQVQSPARLLRLVDGTRRGIATGGHYAVPKPFNEPNVRINFASITTLGR